MTTRYRLEFAGRDEAMASAASVVRIEAEGASDIEVPDGGDLLIAGDNLTAMQALLRRHRGGISMIYIDPPYNRGSEFVYHDDFRHGKARHGLHEDLRRGKARTGVDDASHLAASDYRHASWLAMMYPRLAAARELLAEEGVIFVSIDDREVHRARILLDEIFGEHNFIAQVVWVANRGGRDYMKIAVTHEYLLCYGRSEKAKIREIECDEPGFSHEDTRGGFSLRELRNRNPRFHPGNRPNLHFPLFADVSAADADGLCPVALASTGATDIAIEPRNKKGEAGVWRWGRARVEQAIYRGSAEASDVVARQRRDGGWNVYEKHRKTTTKARSIWDAPALRSECGTIELREVFGDLVFDHPKPLALIRRCLQLGMDDRGVVLDFFAGSGTSAHAVMDLNRRDGGARQFVLIQLAEPTPLGSVARERGFETISDIALARIQHVRQQQGVERPFRYVCMPPRPA